VALAGAVHDGIFPLPLAPKPILVFVFVHANVAPAGVLAKLLTLIVVPGHTAILIIGLTVGVG